MDVLTLGEKKYVKASVIARDLGYTADYVGQLCRGGKVDAQLFGRSWYVNKDSIGDHKSTRYRSTQAKSVQAVRIHIEDSAKKETVPTHRRELSRSLFYMHNSLKASPRYVSDEAPLIPLGKKSGNLHIGLAEATELKIDSKDEKYSFSTPKLPQVTFKGTLALSEFDDTEVNAQEGISAIHTKAAQTLKSDKKTQNKVMSATVVSHKHQKSHLIIPIETDPDQVTERIFSEESTVVSSSRQWIVIASTGLSLAIVVLLLGMESHLSATQKSLVTKYNFEMKNLTATVYNAVGKAD